MAKTDDINQETEVGAVLKSSRKAFIGIGIFSAFINLLMLTGPIYMLQVYDRVLISNSMSTLIALSILMVGLYVFMGFLDFIRSRVLVRVGNQIENELSARTFGVWMTQGLYGKIGSRNRPLDDLGAIKTFASGAGPGAIFDLPFTPLFIAVIWYLHWTLGVLALAGALILLIVALLNERSTRDTLMQSRGHLMQSRQIAEHAHRQSDSVTAMGMSGHLRRRWEASHNEGAQLHTVSADRAGGYTALTKAFRMAIQSGILGLGCALAVVQIITPGAMIAGSIIMGRALAPIQMAIGQWRGFVGARGAYERLNTFYKMIPAEEDTLQLPEPKGVVTVSNVTAVPPGSTKPVLAGINFELKPGQGLGVIGPSASGKSTLARLLVGVWMPVRGSVRLDGATFDQWNREVLGKHIGYLPQDVSMFDGTIRDNICRFDPEAKDEDVVLAAERAGVHSMILHMENGYETKIGQDGAVLSGGQIQRMALARALYGDPQLLVLDEPNANLDNEGDNALTRAIAGCRERGKTVIVMTHRRSAIDAVDMLLMISAGNQNDFGPKNEVLARLSGNQGGAPTPPRGPAPKGHSPQGQAPQGQASRGARPPNRLPQAAPKPAAPQGQGPKAAPKTGPIPAATISTTDLTRGRSFSLTGGGASSPAKPKKITAKKTSKKVAPKKDSPDKGGQS